MAFSLGFNFGKKKQSGTQNTVTAEDTSLFGTQNQATTTAGTTNTNTTGTSSTSGTQTGEVNTNQAQTTSGVNQQTGVTTSLGADVIAALSGATKGVLSGGITDANIAALSEMISGRTGFDASQFVEGTVNAARNRGEQTLQEQNSAFGSGVGGTAGTNSMAALLAQRGRNDLEANLAGIRAQAQGQAEQIQNQNLGAATGAQAGLAGIAAQLAEAAKGGQTTTDLTSLTEELSQLIGSQNTLSSNNENVVTSENSTVNQMLTELTNLISQQTGTTRATEDTKFKGKEGGFGLSLGI